VRKSTGKSGNKYFVENKLTVRKTADDMARKKRIMRKTTDKSDKPGNKRIMRKTTDKSYKPGNKQIVIKTDDNKSDESGNENSEENKLGKYNII